MYYLNRDLRSWQINVNCNIKVFRYGKTNDAKNIDNLVMNKSISAGKHAITTKTKSCNEKY